MQVQHGTPFLAKEGGRRPALSLPKGRHSAAGGWLTRYFFRPSPISRRNASISFGER